MILEQKKFLGGLKFIEYPKQNRDKQRRVERTAKDHPEG